MSKSLLTFHKAIYYRTYQRFKVEIHKSTLGVWLCSLRRWKHWEWENVPKIISMGERKKYKGKICKKRSNIPKRIWNISKMLLPILTFRQFWKQWNSEWVSFKGRHRQWSDMGSIKTKPILNKLSNICELRSQRPQKSLILAEESI